MTLPELLNIAIPGTHAGTCYLCGEPTEQGHSEQPSSSFTAWASCYAGDVMCPGCYALVKDKRWHHLSYWAWREGDETRLQVLSKAAGADFWALFTDPPPPPFAVYFTVGHRKHGELNIIRYINESRSAYWIGTDFLTRPCYMQVAFAREQAPLVEVMRGRKIGRVNLATGEYTMKHYETAAKQGWMDDLQRAKRFAHDARWEVLVNAYVAPE